MIRAYYELTKPGLVYGNALSALAAYLFASHAMPTIPVLVGLLVGLCFSMGAACVFNNVYDRDIDVKMERTKKRALPLRIISVEDALLFAFILSGLGLALLFTLVSGLVWALTLFAMVVYVAAYTPLKHITPHSPLVGAIAGAMPPVAGYAAGSGHLDMLAFLLFILLFAWQMAHFFAIAIYRANDYAEAGIPVLPNVTTVRATRALITAYVVLFAFAVAAFSKLSGLEFAYGLPVGLITAGWLVLCANGWRTQNITRWARIVFFYSLVVLLVMSGALAVSPLVR